MLFLHLAVVCRYHFILRNFYSKFFPDGVRGGFANAFSTASKYEINPEEIKVNFSDVRGVRRIFGVFDERLFLMCELG